MEPGRTTPLTRAEFEQAAVSASIKTENFAEWHDSDGNTHRDGDLPALIAPDGRQEWFQHGKRHRDGDLPASVHLGGEQLWYKRDKCHRDNDLPAKVWADGSKEWWQNGKLHRDNDLLFCVNDQIEGKIGD